MKRIITVIGIVIFSFFSSHLVEAVTFSPSVSINTNTEKTYQKTIDQFLSSYAEKNSREFVTSSFQTAKKKITTILTQDKLSKTSTFILEYLKFWVERWLKEKVPSTSDSTDDKIPEKSDEIEKPAAKIDIDTYEAGHKTIIAGKESGPVARFELIANLESIALEEFSVIASSDIFGSTIQYVRIYDAEGNLVAVDRPSKKTATFRDSGIILKPGSNMFYVTLEPYKIGGAVDTPQTSTFHLARRNDKPVGKISGKQLTSTTKINVEDQVTVVPIGIKKIELVKSYAGYHVDTALYNNVRADLAIVLVHIAPTPNTSTSSAASLKTVLEQLTIQLTDNTVAKNVANTLQLQRIDSSSNIVSSIVNDHLISFDLTTLEGEKNIVEAGNTIALLITGTPTLHATQKESIKIEIDNMYAPALTYTTTDSSAPTFDTTDLQPGYIGEITVHDQ